MPTNKQRISAVAVTTAIVFAGGWFASLLSSAVDNGTDSVGTNRATSEKTLTTLQLASDKSVPDLAEVKPKKSFSDKVMNVSISGIRSSRGKVYVALFDSPSAFDSYDYDRAIVLRELPAQAGSISLDFPDLSKKAYAISLFHDENENQEFDMSGGYPSEGYGTSRAKSAYEELKFHRASIKPRSISIRMHYLQ